MNTLTELSRKYENNIVARAIVNAIPYIGGSLDIALTDRWNKYCQERLGDFLHKLSNELEEIDEKKLNKDFINSEGFFDIVCNIVKDVITSRLEDKRIIYVKMLKEALEQEQNISDLESLISQIEDLKEKDIIFLRYIQGFADEPDKVITGENMFMFIADPINFDIEEVTRMLFRFAYLGLLDYAMNTLTLRKKIKFTTTRLFGKLSQYMEDK